MFPAPADWSAIEGALPPSFYARPVIDVAQDLIGCIVEHIPGDGPSVGGVIVETEAYHDSEPACHAFAGLTPRTQTLFGPPGRAYVYRSYGIHALLNAVCEEQGVGAAVLIRALEPTHGLAAMQRRRGVDDERALCSGPGKLTEALGITREHNGCALDAPPFALYARKGKVDVVSGIRIGLTKAVDLPWRYGLKGSKFLSKPF